MIQRKKPKLIHPIDVCLLHTYHMPRAARSWECGGVTTKPTQECGKQGWLCAVVNGGAIEGTPLPSRLGEEGVPGGGAA